MFLRGRLVDHRHGEDFTSGEIVQEEPLREETVLAECEGGTVDLRCGDAKGSVVVGNGSFDEVIHYLPRELLIAGGCDAHTGKRCSILIRDDASAFAGEDWCSRDIVLEVRRREVRFMSRRPEWGV